MSRFHTLSIKHIHRETKDAVRLDLEVPSDIQSLFNFLPGQYLTFKMKFNDKELRRSYSICSSPDTAILSVAVKEVPGGQFSSHANNELREGTLVEVMEPMGEFILKDSPGHQLFIAAGSGITPIMSMVRTLLKKDQGQQVTLIYGNKGPEEVIFKSELLELEKLYKGRFLLHLAFSRQEETGGIKGRINSDVIDNVLTSRGLSSPSEVYLCGPSAMIFSVKDHFLSKGIAKEHIHFELFTAPETEKSAPHHTEKIIIADKDVITFILDGQTKEVEVKNADMTVLDIALEAGLDAPFACQGGVCCTCKAKVTGDKVDLRQNYSLSDGELKDGYVLTCQSYHQGGQTTVDYDN